MNPVVAKNEFESKIVKNVQEHGCHVNLVFDPEQQEPNFAYSVGFQETVNQPEVIVFGLSREMMHFMVNETWRLCSTGLRLEDWTEVNGLLDGYKCILRRIPSQNIEPEYFNSALWYHEKRTGEALKEAVQIVWPGALDGLFPWDEGCDGGVQQSQPQLYLTEMNS